MRKTTTVRLVQDLLARARRKAAAEGRTLSSLIEEGLRLIVDRKRTPIPVSTATGGLMPGIDLSKSSAIQEIDDIEYVERMKKFK